MVAHFIERYPEDYPINKLIGKQITKEEALNIPQEKKDFFNEEITNMIKNNFLKFNQVLGFTKLQIDILNSSLIHYLINKDIITPEKALETPEEKLDILLSRQLSSLIVKKIISFDQFLGIPKEILNILFSSKYKNIYKLMSLYSAIDFQTFLNSFPEKIEILNSANVYKLKDFITDNIISLEEILNMEEEEREMLVKFNISYLMTPFKDSLGITRRNPITFERFINSNIQEKRLLMVYGIHKLKCCDEEKRELLEEAGIITRDFFYMQAIDPIAWGMFKLLEDNRNQENRQRINFAEIVHLPYNQIIQRFFAARPGEPIRTRLLNLNNQTLHDTATVRTVQTSVDKLEKRYKGSKLIFKNLHEIVGFLKRKADELVEKNQLIEEELFVIDIYLLNLLRNPDKLNENFLEKLFKYLTLATNALEDKNIAQTMCSSKNNQMLAKDMLDRWAGWFKIAIIGAQLGYREDRGNKEIPKEYYDIMKDKTCPPGMLKKIIEGLVLIHPDVEINPGKGTINNLNQYAIEKLKQDQIKSITSNYAQENSEEILNSYLQKFSIQKFEDFNNVAFTKFFIEKCKSSNEIKKNNISREILISTLEPFISYCMDKDLIQENITKIKNTKPDVLASSSPKIK